MTLGYDKQKVDGGAILIGTDEFFRADSRRTQEISNRGFASGLAGQGLGQGEGRILQCA